jgi:ABC-2 type transport system permease protein
MFVMMMASIGASSIVTERQLGTLYRLLAAPISRLEILGGHALALGVQGLFQAAVLFGFARFVYGMSLGSSPLALIVIVVSFLVTAVGFGMLLAAFVQTPAQAGAAGSLVIVALSFLGGVWWPVELMPQLMQQVARLSPTYWAGQGLLNVLVRGQGLSSILHYSAYLLLLGAALMLAGSWLLRRKEV